jgi:hypothetical protein
VEAGAASGGVGSGGAEMLVVRDESGLKLEPFVEAAEGAGSQIMLLSFHWVGGAVTANLALGWKPPPMLVSGDHGVGNPKSVSTKPSSGLRG